MGTTGILADAFLQGLPERDGIWELHGGRVVPHREASLGDNMIKGDVFRAVKAAAEQARTGHHVYAYGAVVRIDDRTVRAPDCIVQTLGFPRARLVEAPLLVADVVVAGLTKGDLQQKLDDYFAIPSLRHYLVVDHARRLILHHQRAGEQQRLTTIVRNGDIVVGDEGLRVPAETILGA